MEDKYLTTSEVANLLKVSNQAVYNWLDAGKLKGYKAGTAWRIKLSDVDKFLVSNKGG